MIDLENVDPHQYDSWNGLAASLAYVSWAVAVLIVLGYFLKLSTTSGNKNKYDFINKNEIKFLWIAAIFLVVGACFFGNSNLVKFSAVLFFVRAFMTVAFGLIVALIIQNLLKFYYPFFIRRDLKSLGISHGFLLKRESQ